MVKRVNTVNMVNIVKMVNTNLQVLLVKLAHLWVEFQAFFGLVEVLWCYILYCAMVLGVCWSM